MTDEEQGAAIVAASDSRLAGLQPFEHGLVDFIGKHGLPTKGVLVQVEERLRVFGNVDHVLAKLEDSRRAESAYISKFLAAAACGLFDAALNYLWDETISELRLRVARYDLTYFFDIAVKDPDRRKKLTDADDLMRVEDSELIRGANELGLVSDLGFKHLDFIRYMRNWASAAHPNQNDITGLQLISWLETCITEVISLPQSTVVGEIRRILANIKANPLSTTEAGSISLFFANLDKERVSSLASGFFGIYVNPSSGTLERQNINLLAPRLWPQVDEQTRGQFGIRLAQFAASGDQERKNLARQFLNAVGGLAYIPDDLRAAEISTAMQDLLAAHRGLNNFYSEPALARRLASLVQPPAKIPAVVAEDYVVGLVEVFLTNGNGIAFNAEPVYMTLLSQLDAEHALTALLSFRNNTIASRLQFALCGKQFRKLLAVVRRIVTTPAVIELIDEIEHFSGPLENVGLDSKIRLKLRNVQTILGIA